MTENNYDEKFLQARSAYLEGDLEQASFILDEMIDENPDDPSVLLLRGHIHLSDQEFDVARGNYQKVLGLTDNEDLIQLAHEGLQKIETAPEEEEEDIFALEEIEQADFNDDIQEIEDENPGDGWTESIQFDNIEWDMEDLEEEELDDPTLQQDSGFDKQTKSQGSFEQIPSLDELGDDEDDEAEDTAVSLLPTTATTGTHGEVTANNNLSKEEENLLGDFDPSSFNYDQLDDFDDEDEFDEEDMEDNSAPTFVVASEDPELGDLEQMLTGNSHLFSDMDDDYGDYSSELEPLNSIPDTSSPFVAESITTANDGDDDEGEELLSDDDFFFAPDDLDDIPDIEADELPVSSIFTKDSKPEAEIPTTNANSLSNGSSQENVFDSEFDNDITGSFTFDTQKINLDIDEDISVSSPLSEISEISTGISGITPQVEVSRGILSPYFDLSLFRKQLVNSGVTAVVTFISILLFSVFQGGGKTSKVAENAPTQGNNTEQVTPENTPEKGSFGGTLILALLTSATTGGTVFILGLLLNKHIRSYTNDLQNQFESIYQGNYEVKITVGSQDEFGTLAAGFNQMAKMINTTTTEARKRAEETERAREDLQRQVIRLLDDVEGAARGDLTVQAEVTADVLGAVADAFNLTITSLRKIVKQVQQAAIQVNKASADSEVFARNQSSDALRMAEELAVTLNSVQMMTDSIQRVAENAQEAEEVARSSSVTALKGGDAVERTVAGILQIRETVSETTRKVKRLAEASQQISTIVAVISQISSRTNLLALNASIQAARAGDAGRGFAIVADEVRQLADRSAKSLQEIEQIVLQIQTETGSVMTAMEEGIQQVRDVTERSEQAKRSLEDIIQVSNRIDALVRSITADTDEQRENSRGVAKVMQAVELTAQATSQESQRVAGSLQNLVGIGKDLISSVERFKVD